MLVSASIPFRRYLIKLNLWLLVKIENNLQSTKAITEH